MSLVNVGNIKGEKGETGLQGVKGDTGYSSFSPIVNVDHSTGQIVITTEDGSATISFDELKGDTGPQGIKGDKETLVMHSLLMTLHQNSWQV